MALNYNPHYTELCKHMNPYLAILQIAQESRQICNDLGNRIPDATALDYAARNEVPDPKQYPDHRLDRVKNYVVYVEDIEVRSAVVCSYEQSLAKNNLVYDYNTIEDEPRKARVRILMNILWDSRPHKK